MANVELVKAIKNGNVVTSLGELAAGDSVTLKGDGASATGSIALNNAANTFSTTLQSGAVASNVTFTLPVADGTANQVIRTDGSGNLSFVNDTDTGIASVQADTSPVLGGNLDVNGNSIVTASNGNVTFQPNGTGVVDFKNDNTQTSEIRLFCESNNSHYVALKSDVHANYSGNVTLTLPTTSGTLAITGGDQTYTGVQRGSITDNGASTAVNLANGNNFKITPTSATALSFNNGGSAPSSVDAGQSGNIYLDATTAGVTIDTNSVLISASDSTRLGTTGKYWLSYFCTGDAKVLVTVSAALV